MRTYNDLPCPMRDGVELKMDLYLPDAEGAYPLVLMRMPYRKENLLTDPLYGRFPRLIEDGYAVAVQDCRGTGVSGGEMHMDSRYEYSDGYDTVEYLAAQPYCDGNIGMFGLSYFGLTQSAAAYANPPHLKAICPFMSFSCENFGGSRMHTVSIGHLNFAYSQILNHPDVYLPDPEFRERILPVLKEYQAHLTEHALHLPVSENPAALIPGVPMLQDYVDLALGVEDESYWEGIHFPVDYDKVHAAELFGTGWMDFVHEGAIDGYQAARRSSDPFTRDNARLVIGPWAHSGSLGSVVEGLDFGPASTGDSEDVFGQMHRFFNRYLKGEDVETGSRVRYFVMGENAWHDDTDWPPTCAADRVLYLASGGRLTESTPEPSCDRFTYDPMDPMPSAHKDGEGRSLTADWSFASERSDVLTYSTEPLTEPVTIVGGVRIRLFAETTAEDTDFSARLLVISPDGYARQLAADLVRAKYRRGMFRRDYIEPGQVTEYEFEIGNTAIRIEPGYRLSVQVSSSLYPKCNRNLNTRACPSSSAEYTVADQTIHTGGTFASCLYLPLI